MDGDYRGVQADQHLIEEPKRKSFSTDVLTLVGGTTMAQIVAILAYPIITRLYGADAYGLAALFSSFVGTITVIACLRYELTIMLPKTDGEAANLLASCILIASMISLMLIPILWFFGRPLVRSLNALQLLPYLWLVPIMVFLTGTFSAINYWNSRRRQFGRLSRAQIGKAVTTSGTQLSAGFTGYASGGSLIGANVVGQAVATLVLAYRAWRTDKRILKTNINRKGMSNGLKQYQDFPKVDIWSALINTLSFQLPVLLITAYFSTTVVGYYSLGMMVLQLPMSLIGSAIAQVFFQRVAEINSAAESNFCRVIEEVIVKLIMIGLCPLVIMSTIGEELFSLVFGLNWATAGTYAQILSILIFFRFIYSPISTLYTVKRKLKAFLFFNILLMSSNIGSLVWGGIHNDVQLGLGLLSLFGGLLYLSSTAWILKISHVSVRRILASTGRFILIGMGILIVLIVIKYILHFDAMMLIVCGAACVLFYYSYVIVNDRKLLSRVRSIFAK